MLRTLTTYTLVAAIVTLAAAPAAAQQDSPELSIINARLIDGTGQLMEDVTINVSGSRIHSVTEGEGVPEGATVIDAAGKTVLPGLIDAHVHLLPRDVDSQHLSSDSAMAARIENELPSKLDSYLRSGITTVMSTGDHWPHIRKVKAQIEAGELRAPRLLTAGPVLTAPGGHPAVTVCRNNPWCREYLSREIGSVEEARRVVRQLSEQGVDAIKMVYDDRSPPGVEKMNPELVGVIAEEAHDKGRLVYTHSYTTSDVIHAIESGVDRLVHLPAFESQSGQLQRLAEMMQEQDVTGATTLTILDVLSRRFAASGDSSLARLLGQNLQGVVRTIKVVADQSPDLIVLGTDAPMIPAGEAFHREVELLREAGLSPRQIIRAATGNAAYHMGLEEEVGTVEPGKVADIIIVDGDPLDEPAALKNVELVIQGGKIVVDER